MYNKKKIKDFFFTLFINACGLVIDFFGVVNLVATDGLPEFDSIV
jgi:hypothetical protein